MNGFTERIVKDCFIAKYDLEEEKKTIIQRIYDYECYIKGLEQCINYNNTMSDFVIRAKISLDNKKQILYKISEEHHRMCGSYRCPAEMTHGGQDMSHWTKYREDLFNDYKQKALNEIRVEWIRLLKNCKTLLTDHDYDMFEEFKKVYPNMANYFDFKANDITWNIAGEYGNNMKNFIDCVTKCLLSQEALNKRNVKIRKQKENRFISNEERRTLLYKKEYECIKILNELDKNKLKSSELYVEYKKITELKDGVDRIFGKHPDLDNNPFIEYFTEYRKKYINGLIELVNNPTPVTNEAPSFVTQVKPNEPNKPSEEVKYDISDFNKVKENLVEKYFVKKQQDTTENNIVMTVVEIKENNTNTAQVCDKPIQKTQKKVSRKEKDIIRVLNIFTNGNIKKKYFDSGLDKVVLNTPLYEPINEYTKNVNGFWEKHTLGVYLNSLYNKELSEFCLDDKKYYEFMCKSTLVPL